MYQLNYKNNMKNGFITIAIIGGIALLSIGALVFAIYQDGHQEDTNLGVPVTRLTYEATLLPQGDNTNDLGTSTQAWRNIYTNDLTFSTTTTGCLESTSTGLVWITGTACGTGSGGVTVFGDLGDVATSSDATGDVYYLNSSGQIVNLGAGSNGQVLTLSAGIPSWAVSAGGGGGGSGLWATTTDDLIIHPVDTSDVVVIGDNATSTLGNILEIIGNALFRGNATTTGKLSSYSFVEAPYFNATSTTATSTFKGLTYTFSDSSASNLTLDRVSGSTFSTVQDLQNIFHSAGWVSGGGITNDTDGTITVALGTGLIRAVNGSTDTIFFFDWASEAGANVNLADNDISYVYAEYNAGSPRIIATITERTDFQTNVLLAVISREGTTLHINEADKQSVGDHANKMIRRLKATTPYGHDTGAIISETGTRNISFTAGIFWRGLTEFNTSSIDTSAAGTFSYYYRDGSGGFTKIATQTQINNTNFDDGDGTLGTVSNNKYGVHWVYLEADDEDIAIVYGLGDYTLTQAQNATVPTSVPQHLQIEGILAGKIIIKKSEATFAQIESAFATKFSGSLATDHGNLAGLADIEDHAYALLIDGTRDFTGNQSLGGFDLTNIGGATTTSLFSTTASSTNLFTSNFSIASLTGFLKATAGAIATALIDLATDVTGILSEANIDALIARDSELHNAVTISGARDYVTLSGQDIIRGVVDIGDDTNLTGDTEIVLTGDALSIASTIARDSELHSAITVSGTPNYITLSGQDLIRAKLDITDDTNATGGLGIDITTNDFTLDLTEINSTTWGSGTFTTMTFDAGAVDPVFTISSGHIDVSTGQFSIASTTMVGDFTVGDGINQATSTFSGPIIINDPTATATSTIYLQGATGFGGSFILRNPDGIACSEVSLDGAGTALVAVVISCPVISIE